MEQDRSIQIIHICVLCRHLGRDSGDNGRSGLHLLRRVSERATETGHAIQVNPVDCMANCVRGCTVAFSAPRGWTYILGEIDPTLPGIADAILACAALQADSTDGTISYFKRPEALRKGTIARIPPSPIATERS